MPKTMLKCFELKSFLRMGHLVINWYCITKLKAWLPHKEKLTPSALRTLNHKTSKYSKETDEYIFLTILKVMFISKGSKTTID